MLGELYKYNSYSTMRKVILFIASSLDGYIARTSGAVDWLFTDQDYGYADFLTGVDTILMGQHTYEQVLSFGEYPSIPSPLMSINTAYFRYMGKYLLN